MDAETRTVYEALRAAAEAGEPCVLATVVETRGSTPRKAGARILVRASGGLVGTVGGGCGEAEVVEAAREVLATGIPRTILVELTDDPFTWSPAVCGGVMRVLLEPVRLPAPGT